MRLTMAHGTRVFHLRAEPKSSYIEDEEGELWVIQQKRQIPTGFEVLCRHATRIEQRLYAKEQTEALASRS